MNHSAATTAITVQRIAERHGPSEPVTAILPTQPALIGDIIDPVYWADRMAEDYPDEAEDVRRAARELVAAYHRLMDAGV